MNQEQAKAWLPLVQAVADGKTIQIKPLKGIWQDCRIDFSDDTVDNIEVDRFRIKPEPKKSWYRVAKMDAAVGICEIANHIEDEINISGRVEFVCWLTDRIEYELPEGGA